MISIAKGKKTTFLEEAPPDKVFWVCDGSVLKSLDELSAALENMGNETFAHHVSKERNDFANWVRDVFGDKKLAGDLKKAKSKEATLKKVKGRVEQLKKLRQK